MIYARIGLIIITLGSTSAFAGDFPGSSLHFDTSKKVVTEADGVKTISTTKDRKLLIGKERQTVNQKWVTRVYKKGDPRAPAIGHWKGGDPWEYKHGNDRKVFKRKGRIYDRQVDNSVRGFTTINSRRKRRNIRARQMREHKRRMTRRSYRKLFKRRNRR